MITLGYEKRRPRTVYGSNLGRRSRLGPRLSLNPAAASPRALGHEAVVTEDSPHPPDELEPSRQGAGLVVLAGRATRVP